MFHGGVPGPKRKNLIQQFRDDDNCRLFLSTDAGGVGLNLQHASAVVIMDQPWNPAVLEQRISRVHRLGQKTPVQVVHLIARGTIEEGMLSLIGFKQSMFAGVLDGGAGEVFLGGTKLNRFMQSVEKATGSIQAAPVEEAEVSGTSVSPAAESPVDDALQQAWSRFATVAAAFLAPLGQVLADTGRAESSTAGSPWQRLVSRDETSGKPCLKLPLPDPTVLSQLASLLQQWTAGAAKRDDDKPA